MGIKQVLMKRDGLTDAEAQELIDDCIEEARELVDAGDSSVMDICEEHFGLEPDYLEEILAEV